jgi:hypothetical protein
MADVELNAIRLEDDGSVSPDSLVRLQKDLSHILSNIEPKNLTQTTINNFVTGSGTPDVNMYDFIMDAWSNTYEIICPSTRYGFSTNYSSSPLFLSNLTVSWQSFPLGSDCNTIIVYPTTKSPMTFQRQIPQFNLPDSMINLSTGQKGNETIYNSSDSLISIYYETYYFESMGASSDIHLILANTTSVTDQAIQFNMDDSSGTRGTTFMDRHYVKRLADGVQLGATPFNPNANTVLWRFRAHHTTNAVSPGYISFTAIEVVPPSSAGSTVLAGLGKMNPVSGYVDAIVESNPAGNLGVIQMDNMLPVAGKKKYRIYTKDNDINPSRNLDQIYLAKDNYYDEMKLYIEYDPVGVARAFTTSLTPFVGWYSDINNYAGFYMSTDGLGGAKLVSVINGNLSRVETTKYRAYYGSGTYHSLTLTKRKSTDPTKYILTANITEVSTTAIEGTLTMVMDNCTSDLLGRAVVGRFDTSQGESLCRRNKYVIQDFTISSEV